MSGSILEQRKRWYRYFPEGSLEFLVATRVLAVVLLLAMVVMHDVQRPVILTALIGVLWFDYVLIVWWAICMTLDLDLLAGQEPTAPETATRGWLIGLKVCLPSVAAAFGLAPWPTLPVLRRALLPGLTVGRALALVLFVVLAVVAQRTMQRIRLGKPFWTALALIPGLHWFALHRIAAGLEARIDHNAQPAQAQSAPPSPSSVAMSAADVTWVLCMLPWLVVLVLSVARGWPGGFPASVFPFCGMFLAAVFGIADLAALERVQRHFTRMIRSCYVAKATSQSSTGCSPPTEHQR